MVDLRNSIRPATVAASIEAAPKQVLELADLGSLFPQGTRVYLPDTGNVPLAAQVEAARRVTAAGYIAVPHIPVRRIESRGAMATRLARLSQDAGVREALVIAGDADRPAGPFASTMDALGSGMFADHGITTIAVAGHPEGNPHASEDELERAIVWKNAFAARSGTDMRIVTQFCFDPRGSSPGRGGSRGPATGCRSMSALPGRPRFRPWSNMPGCAASGPRSRCCGSGA